MKSSGANSPPPDVKHYAFRRAWMRTAARVLDGVGGVFSGSQSTRRTGTPKNLLLVRLDHLGDVWNVTGFPKAIKQHLPGCRVTCLVSRAAAPLLEANPFVDDILRFDAPWFWKSPAASSERLLLREIRRRSFDAALSIRGDIREHWLLRRAGIARRIGPGITGGGFLLTDCVEWRPDRHELERAASVLVPLGLPLKIWSPEIHFAPGERERLLEEARVKGLAPGAPIVGYQVEAGSAAKTWSAAHAARWIRGLLKRHPSCRVALLGSRSTAPDALVRELGADAGGRLHNLCGKLSLRELAACAGLFRVVLAPDSGPAHLLAWLGTPVVFLYSGTNAFESWKPMAEGARVLRHEVSCSPCERRVCPVEGHPCMEGIQPERALDAVLERLS